MEGFWENAIVIARCEAEHKFRIEEEEHLERDAGHETRIADVKPGDYVFCQNGGFSRVVEVRSMTRNIESWRKVEARELPLVASLKVAQSRGEIVIDDRSELLNVAEGKFVTYCTPGVEIMTDTQSELLTKVMDEKGLEAFLDAYKKSEMETIGRLLSMIPTTEFREICEKGIVAYRYDYDAAAEIAMGGFTSTDKEEMDYAVFNLGKRPPYQTFSPKLSGIGRLPADTLKAYSIVTEHGTYVADGLYAKSP